MRIFRPYLAFIFLAGQIPLSGQYAPGAGLAGTDAVHCDSSAIKGWANKSWVKRGPQQAGNQDIGFASTGNNSDCLGKADNIAVSLGDGGEAVVKFTEAVKRFCCFRKLIRRQISRTGICRCKFRQRTVDQVSFCFTYSNNFSDWYIRYSQSRKDR
jgi:hypothetical protein